MAAEKNIPEIRFRGFEGEWDNRKLNTIFNKIRNAFVGVASPYYVNEGHFYLESNNVKDGQINRKNEIFINEEFYQKQKENWLKTGDIVMVQSGHVGHTAVIPQELHNSPAHALIIFTDKKEDTNSYFLNYQFQTQLSITKLGQITTGNTIKHILSSEMKEFVVLLPCFNEQTQIGTYFQNLDSLISLHQRKYDKLLTVKKAMLEKMFPREGANVPEIRFKGFEGKWEKKMLGEIGEQTFGGGTPQTSNNDFWNGSIPWFQSSDLSEDDLLNVITNKKITKKGLSNSATKLVPANSIAIITRVGVGKLALIPFEYSTSQDFLSISHLKTNPYFTVYACYKKIQSELHAVQGTSIKGVTKEELLSKSIFVPIKIEEQSKIGTFFQYLDTQISQHQKQLEKLKNIKKACLDKMFV